jgi:GDP-4-dehydro-6-deoxy-D-mannose reductase
MRLLVTGAGGFVGRWLVEAAVAAGHHVTAATEPRQAPPAAWSAAGGRVRRVAADLRRPEGIGHLAALRPVPDAVIHLAAVASNTAARRDPEAAWALNAGATAALAQAMAAAGAARFLLVSSAEVYGAGHDGPIPETAAIAPISPYAASKAGAELAAAEVARRTALAVVVARPFPHTGPGQSTAYVLPALASRLSGAVRSGASTIPVGNLDAVRDFLDVRDVVQAYLALLDRGAPGEVYNVASGVGRRLGACLAALAQVAGITVRPVEDASLMRPADIPVLIGDPGKLRRATGWKPVVAFDHTLKDLMDAQAH